nr:MAG: capsid protein [Cressdnaviricota sp.]
MHIPNVVGRAAADTLGYVVNGVPGAAYADAEWRAQHPRTPPETPNRRRRARSEETPTRRVRQRQEVTENNSNSMRGRHRGTMHRGVARKKGRKHHKKTFKRAKSNGANMAGASGHSGTARATEKYSRGTKGLKKNEKVIGQLLYRQTNTFKWNDTTFALAGTQSVYEAAVAGSISQWLTTSGTGHTLYQAGTAYAELDPNRKVTGDQGSIIPPGYISANNPMLARSYAFNVCMANLSNLGAWVTLHLCMCKQATAEGPAECWQQGYVADTVGQSATWAPPGAGGLTPGTAGAGYNTFPFAVPSDSLVFKKFWKIIETKEVDLAPAANAKVNFDVLANKVTRMEVLNNLPPGTIAAANTTYVLMAIVKGGMVIDSTPSGSFQPTFGIPEVGIITNVTAKLSNVIGGSAKTRVTRFTDDVSYNALLTNQQVLNEVDVSVPIVHV